MRRIPIALTLAALFAMFALGLAACGGDNSTADTSATATAMTADSDEDADAESAAPEASGPADETVKVTSPPNGALAFDQSSFKTKAGTIEFDFDNPSSVEHNVCVRSASGDELGCSEDVSRGDATMTVDLDAGKYTVYCGEPGHEDGGMDAPLTVS